MKPEMILIVGALAYVVVMVALVSGLFPKVKSCGRF